MTDFWNWQADGAELDTLMAKHSGGSYPPGVLDAYIARQMARHRAMQAEIDRLLASAPSPCSGNATTIPNAVARRTTPSTT